MIESILPSTVIAVEACTPSAFALFPSEQAIVERAVSGAASSRLHAPVSARHFHDSACRRLLSQTAREVSRAGLREWLEASRIATATVRAQSPAQPT